MAIIKITNAIRCTICQSPANAIRPAPTPGLPNPQIIYFECQNNQYHVANPICGIFSDLTPPPKT